MPDVTEVLIWALIIGGGWVLAVQSIRLRRLEKVPRYPLSAQIGRLQEKVRRLQADHDAYAKRQGRHLRELDATSGRLEEDLRAVAEQVDMLPDAVVERLGGMQFPSLRSRGEADQATARKVGL